jgi:hypothetical protein
LLFVKGDYIVVVLIEHSSVIVLSEYDYVTVLSEETNRCSCPELCAVMCRTQVVQILLY